MRILKSCGAFFLIKTSGIQNLLARALPGFNKKLTSAGFSPKIGLLFFHRKIKVPKN